MLRLKSILQYSNFIFYLFLIIILITFIRCNIPTNSKYNLNDNYIEGILIDKKISDNKLSLIIKGKEKVKCTYYINNESDINYYNNLELGITIKLKGTLSVPKNNTVPNTFNNKKYLYYNHINYVMNVDNIEIINNKVNIFYRLKNALINHINKYKSKGYLSTFILGDKSYLEDGVYDNYKNIGVSHLFAISGMHVSILSLIIMKLLFKLKDEHKYIIVITFLLFYIFITNNSPSIIRSVSFFICLYLNKRLDFDLDNQKVFYISIIIILLIDPYLLYNVGFLYSSIISYTLISYSYIIKGNKIIILFKISLLAFLVSLPITINSNYEVNILSVINNLLFVPLVSTIIYPLSLITLLIPPLDNLFLSVMDLVELISNYSLVCNIIIPKMNIIFIIIYYLILYIFIHTYNKKYLLLIILLIIVNKYKYYLDNNYYIYYLDVSQGDSTLIKYKDNITLIDTGGKVKYGDNINNYYYTDNTITLLKSLGERDIDTLVLTHGDYDHMGESIHLINNFKVNKVIFNCGDYNNLENELINELNNKHIKYYSCINKLDNMQFLQTKIYDNENYNSNVIYTEIYNHKFIFMGDASTITENEIMNKYIINNIDVIKVGHHGSKTSSSELFINKINPSYSIISVGSNNKYGHPNKEVLNNLSSSKIYRTDQDGSIMFIINNKIKIRTYNP